MRDTDEQKKLDMKNDTIMKKGINLFVLATLLSVVGMQMAQAQLTDTVRHRIRNYHYSQWFDTCSCCYNEIEDSPTHLFLREVGSAAEWQEHAYSDYALEPIEILGVNLMAKHEGTDSP